ncbi:MAG: type VI secretion system protein ImpF [Paracoccaceae bacterium]|jgi:type VI secretion system protein ImpF
MARNPKTELQIPIMYAFREAHKARDAKTDGREYVDGERVLSERAAMRKRGANEGQLKRNLEIDLIQLSNTINLDAALDMSGLPYVRKSVLNYGVVDLSNFTSADVTSSDLPKRLAEAILNCEPRFIPETLEVKLRKDFDDVQQRLTFDIYAEMACKPVDIPLEFSAEIDVGSGKMKFSNLSGS